MEKNVLLPKGSISPVGQGENYVDYMLSDILSSHGYGIYLIQVDSFRVTSLSDQWYVLLRVCFRIGGVNGMGIGDSVLLLPLRIADEGERVFGGKRLDDIIVRYFYDGLDIVSIAWVSALEESGVVFSFI